MIYNQKTIGQPPIFTSEEYSREASITINASIDRTFPLFGAWEEKKWAPEWNPVPIFPLDMKLLKGSIFKTQSHVPGEDSVIWLVTRYDRVNHQLEYVITGSDRVVIISIVCKSMGKGITSANISYILTGLTPHGNHTSRHILEKLFVTDLKDWQSAINGYLKKAEH